MKKTVIRLSVLTLFLVSIFFNPSYAEVNSEAVTLGVMGGGYTFDDDRVLLDLGKTFSLGLGYNFNQYLAAELSASYIHTDAKKRNDADIYAVQPRVDLLYHIMPENTLVPYLAVGVGGLFFESGNVPIEDTVQANGGLGAKLYVSDNIALRGDARYYYGFEDSDSEYALTAGLVIEFGGKKDTDKDGVYDEMDKCPDTETGVPVNEVGCPDSDGDGVYDDTDQCPGTIQGVRVDSVGCQIKSDPYAVMEKTSDDAAQALEESDKEIAAKMQKPEMINDIIVYFDYKSRQIKPEFQADLNTLGSLMKKFPEITARIEGHTDNIGSNQYNLKLGQERAESVMQYLVNGFGIDPLRFELKSMGESSPAASNKTEQGRAENRRAITITIMK